MRTAVRLLVIIAVSMISFGCKGKVDEQLKGIKAEQKAVTANYKDLALKFLQGIQDGDKNKVYEAANLTTEIVNDSREKLIHPTQYKQTDQQHKDSEHALRTSGNIDFLIPKLRMMFPKSASFQITQSTTMDVGDGINKSEHSIKIAYANKEEAMRDKTGKPVKEMVLHLLQISRSVNGRWIHDFSFDSKEFDKIADKEFEVISYF